MTVSRSRGETVSERDQGVPAPAAGVATNMIAAADSRCRFELTDGPAQAALEV